MFQSRQMRSDAENQNAIQSLYSIRNTTLILMLSAKYLGMIIDSTLNFSEHVNHICKKANTPMHTSTKTQEVVE